MSYGVDTNWYADAGANEHITSDMERFTMHEKYPGHDQVNTVANSQGMMTSHVGQSTIKTPHHDIRLNDVLLVPHA